MDKKISKKTVHAEDSDDGEAKRELKPEQPITDKDSGKGTTSSGKSSGSVSQASDSTSGVEVKCDETDEQPLIPNSPMNPQPSTSGATSGLSPKNNSPKKSPVRKVHEGLSWVKKHLSPKKKISSCNVESSGSSPKKSSRNSRRDSPQKSPKKSPQKISKKPSFRQKLKSPSKKRVPADESKPFLEGDELRHYSSSDEDPTGVKDQGSKQGAIPKTRRLKKSTDQSPKSKDEKSAGFKKKDRKLSEKAAKEAREKLKDKLNKSIAKKIPPAKTAALNDFENFQRFPKTPRPEDGTWSYPRCTTDDGTTTGTPSEVDLSSMSSYKIGEFSDQSLSRASPAVEQIEGGLDVLNNNVPEAAVEHSINSAAEQLARSLNISDTGISSGGGSAAAQVDDFAGSSSGPVPESDSGRQAELGNGSRRNPSNSQYTSYKKSSKLKEMKSQRKKDEENEDDSDENS